MSRTMFPDVTWAGRRMTPERKQLVVAVDHGLPLERVEGLEHPREVVQSLAANPEVDGIIASYGLLKLAARLRIDMSHVARLVTVDYVGFTIRKGTTFLTMREVIVEPDEAAAFQPDACKMFLNMYEDPELLLRNIKDVERFVTAGKKTGVLTLAEVMFYGNRSFDEPRTQAAVFARGCRLAMELGADAIKVPMIGHEKAAAEIIEAVGLPTFVLGGARHESRQSLLLELQRIAALPVCGIMFGRNVWQTEDINKTISDIAGVIRPARS